MHPLSKSTSSKELGIPLNSALYGALLGTSKTRELEELARQQLGPREQLAPKEANVPAKQEKLLRAATLETKKLEEIARQQPGPREQLAEKENKPPDKLGSKLNGNYRYGWDALQQRSTTKDIKLGHLRIWQEKSRENHRQPA